MFKDSNRGYWTLAGGSNTMKNNDALSWTSKRRYSSGEFGKVLEPAKIIRIWGRSLDPPKEKNGALLAPIFSPYLRRVLSVLETNAASITTTISQNYSTSCSTRDIVWYEVKKTYGTTHNTQREHNPLPSLCLHSTPPPSAHPIGMNF